MIHDFKKINRMQIVNLKNDSGKTFVNTNIINVMIMNATIINLNLKKHTRTHIETITIFKQ